MYERRRTAAGLLDTSNDDIVAMEQIGYVIVMKNNNASKYNKTSGTLISFQEGKEGDAYDEVRRRIRDPSDRICRRGVSYLLTQLVHASTESASAVDYYIESVVTRLKRALEDAPDDLDLIRIARRIAVRGSRSSSGRSGSRSGSGSKKSRKSGRSSRRQLHSRCIA